MFRSCNNVQLLLVSQVDKLYGVTGDTDCKVGVFLFLRVLHRIFQFLHPENVDI